MTPDPAAQGARPDGDTELDPEAARKRLRRLNSRASQLKLDLHDLSEELPLGWESILDVAQRTYDAYAQIALLEGQAEKETSA